MLRTLNEKEALDHSIGLNKKMNEWWDNIPFEHKKNIYEYNSKMIEYASCSHLFHTISYYSKTAEHCSKCGYTKYSDEIRNEKITNILK